MDVDKIIGNAIITIRQRIIGLSVFLRSTAFIRQYKTVLKISRARLM